MAGLEALASAIYHEKQQPGSMLCAQHALNSLLQGNYFTAPDLSDIARNLDALEESYDDDRGQTSTNMDDTGFFSIQVLENALKVWGLNLVRWRSEDMRPYHDRPHVQLGFILNLEQHWFTLRRFGPAFPNPDLDPGEGHWFNLNSFLKAPEWVGRTYLGMVLQQAEADGYSVFVVTQADPEAPLALPRVLADEIAATLPEPTSSGAATSSSSRSFQRTMSASSPSPATQAEASQPAEEHFDEEDYELQAALQASLMASHQDSAGGNDDHATMDHVPPSVPRGNVPLPHPPTSISSLGSRAVAGSTTQDEDPAADVDPIAASMERSRLHLQRFQAEQEFAQREMWSEADLSPEELQALQERRERRRQEEEREEEELRRAIEESERLANEHRSKRAKLSEGDDDVEMTSPQAPSFSGGPSHFGNHRVYDDEDAELQAALKASLENVPEGWVEPEPFSAPVPRRPTPPPPVTTKDRDDNKSTTSTNTKTTSTEEAEPESEPTPQAIDMDEIRRRRLARFGG
ncbi:machado-Joseph disease 1 [Coprinopsis cinerea okayama7|uniref:ubiquitinyl hydrolase 1 n=1 Tax=Coprinopsis cinerea (strain Okayama-7 / 130 / ATCC MYA-4618 / FGSC 9003) TaxID=240176 RepID=A8N6X4_COPC7|nr:machado-Joseph disease 1 [Coprinopsis cinerea okayama7\|eukprot:XP_001830580.1 machado-Joseph disease 1 [Coprinopsis cinerea okayama7\